jgi:hypothetical protein
MGELAKKPVPGFADAKRPVNRPNFAAEDRAAAKKAAVRAKFLIERAQAQAAAEQAAEIATRAANVVMGLLTWIDWEEYATYAEDGVDARISPEIPLGQDSESGKKLFGKVFAALRLKPNTTESQWFGGEQSTELADVRAVGVHIYSTDATSEDHKYETSKMWDGSGHGRPEDAQGTLDIVRQISSQENASMTIGRFTAAQIDPNDRYL